MPFLVPSSIIYIVITVCYLNKPVKLASQPRLYSFTTLFYSKASQIPHNNCHGQSIPHTFLVFGKNDVLCFMLTLIIFNFPKKQNVFSLGATIPIVSLNPLGLLFILLLSVTASLFPTRSLLLHRNPTSRTVTAK